MGMNGELLPLIRLLKGTLRVCNQPIETEVRVSSVCPRECVLDRDGLQTLKDIVYYCATDNLIKISKRKSKNQDEMRIIEDTEIPVRT